MVVVQLVDGPVMQPKGHVILGVRGLGSLLCYSAVDDLRDRGARVVVNLDNGRIPQLVKAVSAVREIAILFSVDLDFRLDRVDDSGDRALIAKCWKLNFEGFQHSFC